MNVDLAKLRGVAYAIREIEQIENSLERLGEKLYRCTSQSNGGMPRGGGLPSGMEGDLAVLEELEQKWREKMKEYGERALEAEHVLEQIKNDRVRLFVRLYYLENAPVADVLVACKWTKGQMLYTQKKLVQATNTASFNEIFT